MKHLFTSLFIVTTLVFKVYAIEIKSNQAILLDISSQSILLQKRIDEKIDAEKVKSIALYDKLFAGLKANAFKLNDVQTISEEAWKGAGSGALLPSLYLKPRERISLENLLQGFAVTQGLDAYTSLNALVLEKPHCALNTIKEVALCSALIIDKNPEYVKFFKQTSLQRNALQIFNQNALAKQGLGVAYGADKGSSFVIGTFENLLVMIAGAENLETAESDAFNLLTWGRDGFERIQLFKESLNVGEIALSGYEAKMMTLEVKDKTDLLISSAEKPLLQQQFNMKKPYSFEKPSFLGFSTRQKIQKGQEVGKLQITANGLLLKEVSVFSSENHSPASLFTRVKRFIGG